MTALIDAAKAAYLKAYVPYSNFPVGAAILLKDGRIFTGVNVENASYGLSMCAERSCLFAAISAGVKPEDITQMAVATPQDHRVSPCGACRQVMRELMPLDTPVHLVHLDGAKTVLNHELLPDAFDRTDL